MATELTSFVPTRKEREVLSFLSNSASFDMVMSRDDSNAKAVDHLEELGLVEIEGAASVWLTTDGIDYTVEHDI